MSDRVLAVMNMSEELQQLMSRFSDACQKFSLKKTQVMGQDYVLEVVHDFVYLGSTISHSLCIDQELNKHIGKAATTKSRLTNRVWTNNKLTQQTKIQVYRACVMSTLLYGSESWTLHAQHVM